MQCASTTHHLPLQHLRHLPHADVCSPVHRPPVDVVAKLPVGHDKHADVAHGTQVNKLSDVIRDEALVDEKVEEHLDYVWGRYVVNLYLI